MDKTLIVLFWEGCKLYVDISVFVPIQMEGGELREKGDEETEATQEGNDWQGRLRHL